MKDNLFLIIVIYPQNKHPYKLPNNTQILIKLLIYIHTYSLNK